jgi:hypothetical protein
VNEHLKRSRVQEKRLAKEAGGYVNPRSGAGDWHKNDIRTESLSIEAKTTSKSQYSLKNLDLLLAEKNALLAGRDMAFIIDMCGRSWTVVPTEEYLDLREAAGR